MNRSRLHVPIAASLLAAIAVAWGVGIEVPPGLTAGVAPK